MLLWGFVLARPGLWHGVDDENGNTVFFLYLDAERSRVYTPQWSEEADLVVDGDQVQFKLPYKSYGIRFEGNRAEEKISGTWKIHQVQYVIKGTWTAREVFAGSDWKPWDFVKSDVDTVGKVLEQSCESLDTFRAYWKKEIEPVYFALLTQSLYADSDGDYRLPLREKRLERVYAFLQSGKELLPRSKTVLDVLPKVRKKVREKYPWVENLPVFLVFSGGEFDYSLLRTGDQRFLLLALEWFATLEGEEKIQPVLAEGLIYSFHSMVLPLATRGETEVIRRSISLQSLPQFDLVPFGAAADESLEETKEKLSMDFRLPRGEFYRAHLTGGERARTYQLLKQFGEVLAAGRSAPQLFVLTREQIYRALRDFFGIS